MWVGSMTCTPAGDMKVNAGLLTALCCQCHGAAAVAACFLIARLAEIKCLDRVLFSPLLLLPAESVRIGEGAFQTLSVGNVI
uniref:Uncharacterized protein n=1 Tax=Ixodes ricinus TaxID=34613 RepID=A0A6B0U5W3_IXORI